MVHPDGNPVWLPAGVIIFTIAVGTLICALTLNPNMGLAPVLPTVTCITPCPPTLACPEFNVRIFREAFVDCCCPKAPVIERAPKRQSSSDLISFMSLFFGERLVCTEDQCKLVVQWSDITSTAYAYVQVLVSTS